MRSDALARPAAGPIQDLRVRAVIEQLHASARPPEDGGPRSHPGLDPAAWAEYGFSISPDQGELNYLLCRAIRARRVVEFATSVGMWTLGLKVG